MIFLYFLDVYFCIEMVVYILEISLRSTGVASESPSINARTRILFVL